QTTAGHHRRHTEDGAGAPAPVALGRRRHPDQGGCVMPEVKGILGDKLGITQIFDDARAIPVTVIKAGPCYVAQVKTTENDGYSAVQIAFADYRDGKINKPMQGHFEKHGDKPGKYVVELRTDDASRYSPGQELRADVLQPGEHADAACVSGGKG